MQAKRYAALGGTTATPLRLVEAAGLQGTGRVVIGDSWFASIKVAVELHKLGLYFIGAIRVRKSSKNSQNFVSFLHFSTSQIWFKIVSTS